MERKWTDSSLHNVERNTKDAEWLKTVDRRFESDDGIIVVNREFESKWGIIDHLAIKKESGAQISWSEKQQIKRELLGNKCAIEIYPTDRDNLDSDYDHLWVLQNKTAIPFNLGEVSERKIIVREQATVNVEDFLIRIAKNLGIHFRVDNEVKTE